MRKKDLRAYFSRLGRRGGKTAAANMTPEQRTERARKGGLARQAKRQEQFTEKQ